jgi:hypothetical protein
MPFAKSQRHKANDFLTQRETFGIPRIEALPDYSINSLMKVLS